MHVYLETGQHFEGRTAVSGEATAELVFTTAYTGYEESLTDPSYNGQGLVFCYPLIGNYGVDERRFQSPEVQPNVVIAREFDQSVENLLYERGVPAVDQVDTRGLTRLIRECGSLKAGIAPTLERARELCFQDLDMTFEPSQQIEHRGSGNPNIALLDCGVKEAMLERLSENAHVIRFPWNCDKRDLFSYQLDMVFVSNGPGNPENYQQAIETVQYWESRVPVAGICLGQQIIAHALGAETRKMKFGHRGSNQPVMDLDTKQVKMTTQNHSYEVIETSLPEEIYVTERNVNDDSPEGLARDDAGWESYPLEERDCFGMRRVTPILTRQYHPEANPGPNDSQEFFEKVVEIVQNFQ